MKKFLFVILLISFNAVAAPWPHVYLSGNAAMLQVWNHDNQRYNCSGFITMNLEEGQSETHHVFEMLWPRQVLNRYFYPRDFNAKVTWVNHSVWCR